MYFEHKASLQSRKRGENEIIMKKIYVFFLLAIQVCFASQTMNGACYLSWKQTLPTTIGSSVKLTAQIISSPNSAIVCSSCITYSSSDPSIAEISGDTLKLINIGTVGITAHVPASYSSRACGAQAVFSDIKKNITVSKLNQTIEWNQTLSGVYCDTIILNADANSGLPILYTSSNSKIGTINRDTLFIKSVGLDTITAKQTGNSYYDSAMSVSKLLVANKALLVITADNKIRNKGEQNPLFTAKYRGFKNNENQDVLDTLPTISCRTNETTSKGFYDIVLSGGFDNNYSYNFVNGLLEIKEITTGLNDTLVYNNSSHIIFKHNKLFIQSGEKVDNVSIYDINSRMLFKEKYNGKSIDISNFPQGVYFVNILLFDNHKYVKKIIKK